MIEILNTIGYILFLFLLSYYVLTNLQWYSYRLERVVFHHTKPKWHLIYFLMPTLLYLYAAAKTEYSFVVALLYAALLFQWYKGLDKKLLFTGRIKRAFLSITFFALFISLLTKSFAIITPLILGWFASSLFEKILFSGYKNQAKQKLEQMKDLKVVGVTASYGKTSIKNYIAHLLSGSFKSYATPRSVNTLGGVIKDINEDLPKNTEVYVVEMGARNKGDIKEITTFVEPHITVTGQIGPAHIEYFKTLENIRNTKMEIIQSQKLQKAFVHESALVRPNEKVEVYGKGEVKETQLPPPKHLVTNIEATLEHTCFELDGQHYCAKVLGAFNAENLAVAILVAKEMGLSDETIKERIATIKPTPHRLQRIDAGGKVIIDDSFNGNIDGMLASFDLISSYEGRKVLITPGLVEVDEALNEQVAKRANKIFDLIIITGDLNYPIFNRIVDANKLHKLESKEQMEQVLMELTKSGDLILFANDAPSYI